MKFRWIAILIGALLAGPLSAQVPDSLLHSIPAPSGAGGTGDNFSRTVAISGTWMVVGAPNDDTGASNAGRAYVYDLASGTPTVPVLTLNNPSPTADDLFGYSVAIAGTRVVVGVPFDDVGPTDVGRVYVYDLASGTPTVPVVTLNNPNPATGDRLGWAVAISGTRIVAGAPWDDLGASNAGRAFVYDLASGTPTVPVAALNNPNPGANEYFGLVVAISGTNVVVAASEDDTGAADAGSAYIYDLSSATPTVPTVNLNDPKATAGDYFGFSVAISGNRVVVGAGGDDTGAMSAGRVYVYDVGTALPVVPVVTLDNPNPVAFGFFGRAVGISGNRVLVGAYGDDTGANSSGRAYVYDLGGGTPTVPISVLENPSPAVDDRFGYAVALDGTTALVGAPYDDMVAVDKGSAYVFAPSDPDYDNDGLLDMWEYARFGSLAAAAADDDTDGDGRPELLEQAFNTDPLFPDAPVGPAVVEEGGYLTLTISKRAGVSYLGESAGNLEAGAFSAATVTIITNSASTLKVRDDFPMSGGGTRFLRMKVTAAP